MNQSELPEYAESLCPVCLAVLPAEIRQTGDSVFLCRTCPKHGFFQECIWRGTGFAQWHRPKSPVATLTSQTPGQRGCPYDCGLCPEHGQHACTVLLEITRRCNLNCPVCFANSGTNAGADPSMKTLRQQLHWIRKQAGEVVLQLSGGEPTLHQDLVELTAEASRLFPAVQLNTNGLLLAEHPNLALRLAQNGLSWVFLQFDGVSEQVFTTLRGQKLLTQKMAALEACAAASLPVIMVPTVAAGINDSELGDLLHLAVNTPIVRGLHIQPMTTSGRNPFSEPQYRLTLPEVLSLLEKQGAGMIHAHEASPPGCEHERCSFHLRYRRLANGKLLPRPGISCADGCACNAPSAKETLENRNRAVELILHSWKAPVPLHPTDAFDDFLNQARQQSFSITCMAFQDARTMELDRLRGCCVHVFQPPDRFIPFCAMNLCTENGHPLYRKP